MMQYLLRLVLCVHMVYNVVALTASESCDMILYLDASALAKLFLMEVGSVEAGRLVSQALVSGTAVIGRAEVAAAFARLHACNGSHARRPSWPSPPSAQSGRACSGYQ
jgi:hypothetical protein